MKKSKLFKEEIEVIDNGHELEFFWDNAHYYFPKKDLDESVKRVVLSNSAPFALISDYYTDENGVITLIEMTWGELDE